MAALVMPDTTPATVPVTIIGAGFGRSGPGPGAALTSQDMIDFFSGNPQPTA